MEPKWWKSADVLIAGYGAAGAAAAIAAHDAGAEVLIIEKMNGGGGNTLVSMGGFLCPSDAEDAMRYISALYDCSHSEKDEKLIRTFAEEAVKNVQWIRSLKKGTDVHLYGHAGFSQLPGSEAINKYLVKGKNKGANAFAKNLWEVLTYAVEKKRRISVLKETAAKELVANNKGEVIGIVGESEGRTVAIRADRGVILCTGGYEYDQSTLRSHVKGFPIYAAGNPGNRGDGIRMAQRVGAGLWHMNAVSCGLGIKVPDFEACFPVVIDAPGHILVDREGRRFMNERGIEAHSGLLAVDHYDTQSLKYPRIPCYAIFDETSRLRGPISRLAGLGSAGSGYQWSKDNSTEIRKGWIHEGRTLAELAKSLSMTPAILDETVAKWNRDVKNNTDTLYHRPILSPQKDRPEYKDVVHPVLSAAIDRPPFYAMELYPCLLNTQGGPRRNDAAQVLDPFGRPIPRLYSAGELGSMWGMIYQGAGNISECFVFGRIAGKNAAAERSWS
jgi:succinate dehydrogenase/fumarate reductase flavoprotein subunit